MNMSELSNTNSALFCGEDFDPLKESDTENNDFSNEDIVGFSGDSNESLFLDEDAQKLTTKERINNLLVKMAPRRRVLLDTIGYCSEPKQEAEVNEYIDQKQAHNQSVFSSASLCTILEKAGALAKVSADGTPLAEAEVKPNTVVIDGVEYLEPQEPVAYLWKATEEGLAAVAADAPLESLRELFLADRRYLSLYRRILTLCNAERGATTAELREAVDNDALVQNPRLIAPYFTGRLEAFDALEWKKVWTTTPVGCAALDVLAELEKHPSALDSEEA